ncbi:MAG: CotH kinase family protein [Saprospiraceae bacterium]|nr:CotH kinase family protein [Saprospiraceae bacterium]
MQRFVLPLLVFVFVLNNKQRATAQDFYASDAIQEIRIYFSQPNWDYLLDSLNAADEEARLLVPLVLVNGVAFDSVGVKYKGNSSYNPNRPKNPFSIKLDEVIENQDYQGHTLVKLSNGFKDPSFLREALGYEIANQYMDAPRANYARVYVNDNYHGLYTNVESIKSKFLSEHYYSSDNALFKCDPIQGAPNPPGCPPSMGGGATFVYMGADSSCYLRFYEIESDYGWNDLVSAANVLNNTPINAHQAFDIDRILWMLAFNNILVNLDSYSGSGHNYYIYKDDNGRFLPIVWDLNETFGNFTNAGTGGPGLNLTQLQQLDPLLHVNNPARPFVQKLLANPKHRKSYIAHLRTILQENFVNNNYQTRGQVLQALIDEAVQADLNKFYSYANFQANLLNNVTGPNFNIIGIATLMEARETFLLNHPEWQNVPPNITGVTPGAGQALVGNTVQVTAIVANATLVRLRYRFNRAGIFEEIPMFDDGAHGDGAPNDGVYGAALTPLLAGKTDYYIYAENNVAAMFSPQRAEHEFYTLTVTSGMGITEGAIVINELLAANDLGITDPEGQYEDWIELYNTTSSDIPLEGVFLSDDATNPDKWTFPAVTIPAGGYLLLWADEDQNQEGLHTNFKLSKNGEEILLSNTDGTIIDEVVFGAQETDVSWGRCPDGTGGFVAMTPTPGAANLNCTTSVSEPGEKGISLRLFPNPLAAGQSITLVVDSPAAQEACLSLINGQGATLFAQALLIQAGAQEVVVNPLSNLPQGLYWMRLVTAGGVISAGVAVSR